MNVDVIIPALNEAASVGEVVRALGRSVVRTVIVADNGSTDGTGRVAAQAGAVVVLEPERGYGAACLRAMDELPGDTDIVLFCDADGSDPLGMIPDLVAPIVEDRADLVVGSRELGEPDPGSLTFQQRVGNRIAAQWLRRRFGLAATDLGPMRAVRRDVLDTLRMSDRNYGWTVEMQIKVARLGLRYVEIPVGYHRRVGRSKVSGTLRGTLGATYKILGLLAYYDVVARER